MYKVGDETEGFCPRCRLNTYQVVSATDGRTIFSATCRTCRNTFAWKPEVTMEEQRQKQMQKLQKLTRNKMSQAPVVMNRGRKSGGDLDAPLKALAALHGREVTLESRARADNGEGGQVQPSSVATGEVAASPVPESSAGQETATAGATQPAERWRLLTAKLGWRDGKPYQPTRSYEEGDVMLHKGHGLGIVQSVVHAQACVVLFRDIETVVAMGQRSER